MRATKLRQMLGEGVDSWKRYVPSMVARYIINNGLYQPDAGCKERSA